MDLSTQQKLETIARFLSGNMPGEELSRFQEWLGEDPANRQLLEEALAVWQLGEEETLPDFDKDMDEAWTKVEQHIQRDTSTDIPAEAPRVRQVPSRKWALRIAASLAFLLLAAWALFQLRPEEPEMVVYATGTDETRNVVLPDSSAVWLNERTTLRLSPDFSKREVELKGEAFFEVRRMENSPFRVHSGGTITEVLGTSFNIRAYPEEGKVELTVETGKVAFGRANAPDTPLEVTEGSSAVFEERSDALFAAEEKIGNATSWHTGKFNFEDATLETVRLSFERFYGIRLQVDDPSVWKCHFDGAFDNASPSEFAETVAFTLSLELTKTDSVYTLSGKGCGGG